MIGEAEREETEGSFSEASIPKRLAIVVAGATVNIVFGIVVYFILMNFSGTNASTVIREMVPEYSENISALEVGDKILKINNKKIHTKRDIDNIVQNSNGDTLNVEINRDEEILNLKVNPSPIVTKSLGVYFSSSSDLPEIKYIAEGSTAEKAGVMVNDLITKIEDTNITSYSEISEAINNSENEKIHLEVDRKGETVSLDIEPEIYTNYVLGVYLEEAEKSFVNNMYYAYWNTGYFLGDILENVKMIFTGNVNINQMVGPIGISEMVIETNGFYDFIYLMSIVSLSLGVTNLLPIPALDGGRIVILLIEGIRRKPLKEEVEMQIQMIGFTLLILFSLYVSYKDILRIF